jgi:hypothetical protein
MRRREVAARIAVHPLHDAVNQHWSGIDDRAIQKGRPLWIRERKHVEECGVEARREAAPTMCQHSEVAVYGRCASVKASRKREAHCEDDA